MENAAPLKENKMGIMPVNRLLITMSIPMMVSMLIQALYNVVDSIFVSQINENALTAVSLAFPIQNLMIAVGSGTAVGVNALLSRSLGEKNYERVNAAACNGIFLAIISYVAFALLGYFISPTFFAVQTKDAQIVEYGVEYITICSVMSFGIFGQLMFERLLQSTGKTLCTMITQGIGAIINIVLDPIMIFGYFGLPAMGVAGAAWATVIGQIVAATIAVILNVKINHEVKLRFKGFRPNGKVIKMIYAVGVPSIVMMAISSVMTFLMNKILLIFSSTAAAVFGVYYKLQSFVFMPVFGLNNGMVPIVSYNYGAKKKERMIRAIKLSILYAVLIMLIGFALMQIIPGPILKLFNASDNLLLIGETALRILSISFVLAGFCVISTSVFQALGKGLWSLWVSIGRQLVVLIPVAYLFSLTGVLENVWWAFPIAELASGILCAFGLRHTYKKVIAPIPSASETTQNEPVSQN